MSATRAELALGALAIVLTAACSSAPAARLEAPTTSTTSSAPASSTAPTTPLPLRPVPTAGVPVAGAGVYVANRFGASGARFTLPSGWQVLFTPTSDSIVVGFDDRHAVSLIEIRRVYQGGDTVAAPADIGAYLRQRGDLDVSEATSATLGSLQASQFTVRVNDRASRMCGNPARRCALLFALERETDAWMEKQGQPSRYVVGRIGERTVAAVVTAPAEDFDQFVASSASVVGSIRFGSA